MGHIFPFRCNIVSTMIKIFCDNLSIIVIFEKAKLLSLLIRACEAGDNTRIIDATTEKTRHTICIYEIFVRCVASHIIFPITHTNVIATACSDDKHRTKHNRGKHFPFFPYIAIKRTNNIVGITYPKAAANQ